MGDRFGFSERARVVRATAWVWVGLGVALSVTLVGCGSASGLDSGSGAGRDGVDTCLPPCFARLFASCPAPKGACSAYLTAAANHWKMCFASGLVLEARPDQSHGGHRYRQGSRVCASYESVGAATVLVDTWRDANGARVAEVVRPYTGSVWQIECDGQRYEVDTASAECAGDVWLASQNPFVFSCDSSQWEACGAQ